MTRLSFPPRPWAALFVSALSLAGGPALADAITGDLTVTDKLCVGDGCVAPPGQLFSLEAIRVKAFNAWIRFEDSSTSANLPTNDWQITVNENAFRGADFFAIEDLDGGTMPFRVDAGARADALRMTSDGFIGLGTGMPQEELHIRGGDSPTIRLEQDGSQDNPLIGWDLGGNEFNFFIREGGSLPFRILPGPGNNNNGIVIADDGAIGLGTQTPEAKLHVAGTSMLIKNAGRVNFTLSDTSDPGPDFRTQLTAGTARFSFVGTGAPEMELFQSGDLAIRGRYISAGTTLTVPDYVFDEDYALRPLAEVQSFIDANSHLPDVPSAADIAQDGLDMTEMQMTLLKKIEELTLYTLEQQDSLRAQRAQISDLKAALSEMRAQLQALTAVQ